MPFNCLGLSKLFTVAVLFGALLPTRSFAAHGGLDSGGGTDLVREFIAIARQEVYLWLVSNERSSQPIGVSSGDFLASVNQAASAGNITSTPVVYKSCLYTNGQMKRQSPKDDEVAACFSEDKKIYLSEHRWPGRDASGASQQDKETLLLAKMGVVAHEVFRLMNIGEGDSYRYSSQIPVMQYQNNEDAILTASILRTLGTDYCSKAKSQPCSTVRLRDFPGIRLVKSDGSDSGPLYVFDDALDGNTRSHASFNIVEAKQKAKKGFPLFALIKDVKVSAVTSQMMNFPSDKKSRNAISHYGRPSPNCVFELMHWEGDEPLRQNGDILLHEGEVMAVQKFKVNAGQITNFITFQLQVPGRSQILLSCPQNLINPDSTVKDIEIALGGAIRIFP